MNTLALILGYASGFALMGYQGAAAEMIATSLVVDAALIPLTAVIAARRGRSVVMWSVAGFPLGLWALAFVLLVHPATATPSRSGDAPYPPSSDAA